VKKHVFLNVFHLQINVFNIYVCSAPASRQGGLILTLCIVYSM